MMVTQWRMIVQVLTVAIQALSCRLEAELIPGLTDWMTDG